MHHLVEESNPLQRSSCVGDANGSGRHVMAIRSETRLPVPILWVMPVMESQAPLLAGPGQGKIN